MFDTTHFSRDSISVSFEATDGVTTDDNETVFEWNKIPTVHREDSPYADAFDTEEFYRLEATVARPIKQDYRIAEDADPFTFVKPKAELKKAAWSLDNRPWTIEHPETGMVRSVDDVRGFWDDTTYHDTKERLQSFLHVPTDDKEAKEFIADYGDVSVGFFNKLSKVDEYTDDVGLVNTDGVEKDVDGYQTDMLFDHCASVKVGRCSNEDGCGIGSPNHGHMATVSGDALSSLFAREQQTKVKENEGDGDNEDTDGVEDEQYPVTRRLMGICSDGECGCGLHAQSSHSRSDRTTCEAGCSGTEQCTHCSDDAEERSFIEMMFTSSSE